MFLKTKWKGKECFPKLLTLNPGNGWERIFFFGRGVKEESCGVFFKDVFGNSSVGNKQNNF